MSQLFSGQDKIKKIDTCNYFANADTNKLIYNLLRTA